MPQLLPCHLASHLETHFVVVVVVARVILLLVVATNLVGRHDVDDNDGQSCKHGACRHLDHHYGNAMRRRMLLLVVVMNGLLHRRMC